MNEPMPRDQWIDREWLRRKMRLRTSSLSCMTDQLYMEKGNKSKRQVVNKYVTLIRA